MRFQVVVGQLAQDATVPAALALSCTFTFDSTKLVASVVSYSYSDPGFNIVGKYVC